MFINWLDAVLIGSCSILFNLENTVSACLQPAIILIKLSVLLYTVSTSIRDVCAVNSSVSPRYTVLEGAGVWKNSQN